MKRRVRIGSKIIDWRDATCFTIKVPSANTTVNVYLRPISNGWATIDWGNGVATQRNLSNSGGSYGVITYVYPVAGIYKVNITSSVGSLFDCLSCTYIQFYNQGFFKKGRVQKWLMISLNYSTQDITNVFSNLEYLSISTASVKLNLSELTFNQSISTFVISGTNANLYGRIQVPNTLPALISLELRGSNSASQGFDSILNIVNKTPNCLQYSFQFYHANADIAYSTDLTDLYNALLPKANTLKQFIFLTINKGIYGNGAQLFKMLFESPTCTHIYLTTNTTGLFTNELGVQQGDLTSYVAKILYLSLLTGNASTFNFKYKAQIFLVLYFTNTAYGDINSIANVTQDADLTSLSISTSTVLLDVSNIKNIRFNALLLIGSNNISGDISLLSSRTMCSSWTLSSLTSTSITGWSELVLGIYNNKFLFVTAAKSFSCPNVMKAALSGTYQAPAGVVKGSADGTPVSDRERIYVLVNNYNWTFTNIS